MGQKIERDHQRFRKIVRGKVKSNLGKYISRGEMIGKKGNDLVSIPLPQIEIPQFRFGNKGSGGVGQGDGQVGQPIGQGQQPGRRLGAGGGRHQLRPVAVERDALILGAVPGGPRVIAEPDRQRRPLQLLVTLQLAKSRSHEDLEGDQR